jgi:hypothetical protein
LSPKRPRQHRADFHPTSQLRRCKGGWTCLASTTSPTRPVAGTYGATKMERCDVRRLCDIASALSVLESHFKRSAAGGFKKLPFARRFRDEFSTGLLRIADSCEKVSLDLTVVALRKATAKLDKKHLKPAVFRRTLSEIRNRFIDEVERGLFFWVPKNRAEFYDGAPKTWKLAIDAFPSIAFDANEAFKCHCLGRHTAAVYHLMRTLEVAIASISRELSITAHTPTWHAYLSQMEDASKAKFPGPGPNRAKRDFFAGIRSHLSGIKDGYRNPTMHAIERIYTEEEAANVFALVRGLFQELSKEVKE